MIDDERLREMFFLFGLILPTGDDIQNETFKVMFGGDLKVVLPIVVKQICEEMLKRKDTAETYLDFMLQAISYAKMETDDLPEIADKTQDELKIILAHR